MHEDITKILISETEIKDRVKQLGEQISKDYEGKNPVIICILRGGIVFLSDLMRSISTHVQLDFMSLSSYGNSTKSSGVVQIKKDIDVDISNRDVIIVEDIVDSGLTLNYLNEYFKHHNSSSIRICTLLDKPNAHKIDLAIDYIGFEVGNEFVVGYGLDYAQKYRNIPYIGILKKEIYT